MAKVKAHFKLHVSVASHRNTAVIWANPIDRAIYVELGRLAITKFASKTNNTFWLSASEMMGVTCCQSASAAGSRMRAFMRRCVAGAEQLGGSPPLTAEQVGSGWRVTFRNLAKKQGFFSLMGKDPPAPKTKAKTKAKTEAKKQQSPPPAVCVELAEHLSEWIRQIQPGRKLPKDLDAWAWVYEKAIRRDGRCQQALRKQIAWLFGPDNQTAEARFEVFSAGAHRAKFDAIERGMQRAARTIPELRDTQEDLYEKLDQESRDADRERFTE